MDRLGISSSALLVIDVQDSFKRGERWSLRNNPAFEDNVSALIAAYRRARLPIFFILHTDADPGFRVGDPEVRLMEFVDRREDDPLLIKSSRNSFTTTDLQRRLVEAGVRRLVISGISTEQCCETTTRVAADLGYDVDFVTEATLTFPIVDPFSGLRLEADEITRRTEFVLRDRFARITSVEQLIAELEERCSAVA